MVRVYNQLKMWKNLKHVDKKKISFLKSINNQILILFVLILISCIFVDCFFKSSIFTVPFIVTTLVSSFVTFISIPKLKRFKIKQIIRKEGPKNHFFKEGTPTMCGIFFIPIGIIISNILYFNKDNYNVILTLSFLIIFFMFIGFFDYLLSL